MSITKHIVLALSTLTAISSQGVGSPPEIIIEGSDTISPRKNNTVPITCPTKSEMLRYKPGESIQGEKKALYVEASKAYKSNKTPVFSGSEGLRSKKSQRNAVELEKNLEKSLPLTNSPLGPLSDDPVVFFHDAEESQYGCSSPEKVRLLLETWDKVPYIPASIGKLSSLPLSSGIIFTHSVPNIISGGPGILIDSLNPYLHRKYPNAIFHDYYSPFFQGIKPLKKCLKNPGFNSFFIQPFTTKGEEIQVQALFVSSQRLPDDLEEFKNLAKEYNLPLVLI
jgi:hypothetical protein